MAEEMNQHDFLEKKLHRKHLFDCEGVFLCNLVFIFFLCMVFSLSFQNKAFSYPVEEVPQEVLDSIRKLADTAHVSDMIGQLLMIGPPSDYRFSTDSDEFYNSISQLGIGGFIINSYHLYGIDNDDSVRTFNEIIRYTNKLQEESYRKNFYIPAFIALDYESYEFSSLKALNSVPHLPSQLALATTRDLEQLELAGAFAGHTLGRLGFNVLLGPVVDIIRGNSRVNDNYSYIQHRSFSSEPDLVLQSAAYFLSGFRDAGILTISKHFPGLGSVDTNPHVLSQGGDVSKIGVTGNTFAEDLKPFSAFMKYTDGVMTSHVSVGFSGRNMPVTVDPLFSSDVIRSKNSINIQGETINGLGLGDGLLVTDDMSDMGSIIQYKKNNKLTWGDLAVLAFDAGHDILLFSHVESTKTKDQKRVNLGKFTFLDLVETREKLINHIISSPSNEQKFRDSLFRILLHKYKLNNKFGSGIPSKRISDNLFSPIQMDIMFSKKEIMSPSFLLEKGYSDYTKFIEKIISSSYIHVSGKKYDYKTEFLGDRRRCLIVKEFKKKLFIDKIGSRVSEEDVVGLPILYDSNSFEKFKKIISEKVKECDITFMHVERHEESDFIDYLGMNGLIDDNFIAICHISPTMIKRNNLTSLRLFGAFTTHPIVYDIDIDFILGRIEAGNREKITVSVEDRAVLMPPDIVLPAGLKDIVKYASPSTRFYTEIVDEKNTSINQKNIEIQTLKTKLAFLVEFISKRYRNNLLVIEKEHSIQTTNNPYLPDINGLGDFFDENQIKHMSSILSDGILSRDEIISLKNHEHFGELKTIEVLSILEFSAKTDSVFSSVVIYVMVIVMMTSFYFLMQYRPKSDENTNENKISFFISVAFFVLSLAVCGSYAIVEPDAYHEAFTALTNIIVDIKRVASDFL